MSWAAVIRTHRAGLRLRFRRPVQVLDLSPEKARELAAVLLVVAEQAEGRERVGEQLESG